MKITSRFDRRSIIGGLSVVAASTLAALPALSQSLPDQPYQGTLAGGLRFRSIVLDNSSMAAKGGRAFVELIRSQTGPALARAFADVLAPGDRNAPELKVLLESASFGGSSSFDGEIGGPTDYIEGGAVLLGPRGAVIGSYPLLASRQGITGDRIKTEYEDRVRAQLLAESFAYWLRRKIGV